MGPSELVRLMRGGHCQDLGAGCQSGGDSCRRVLDDEAAPGVDAESASGHGVPFRVGFASSHVICGDHHLRRCEPGRFQTRKHDAGLARGHRRPPLVAHRRDRLARPRQRDHSVEVGLADGDQFFDCCLDVFAWNQLRDDVDAAPSMAGFEDDVRIEAMVVGPGVPRPFDRCGGVGCAVLSTQSDAAWCHGAAFSAHFVPTL